MLAVGIAPAPAPGPGRGALGRVAGSQRRRRGARARCSSARARLRVSGIASVRVCPTVPPTHAVVTSSLPGLVWKATVDATWALHGGHDGLRPGRASRGRWEALPPRQPRRCGSGHYRGHESAAAARGATGATRPSFGSSLDTHDNSQYIVVYLVYLLIFFADLTTEQHPAHHRSWT